MAAIRTEARLDSTNYHAGIQKMKADTNSWAGVVESASKRVQKTLDVGNLAMAAGKKLMQALAPAGLSRQMEVASKINDLAFKAQMTTDEFQALGQAFRNAGSDEETLAQISAKLGDALGTAIDEADKATKPMTESFGKLGVSLEDAVGLGKARLVLRIGSALVEAKNGGEQLSAAINLVGKSAPNALQALNEIGGSSLPILIQRAREAGVVMSADVVGGLDKWDDWLATKSRKTTATTANVTTIGRETDAMAKQNQALAENTEENKRALSAAQARAKSDLQAAEAEKSAKEQRNALDAESKKAAAKIAGGMLPHQESARFGGLAIAGSNNLAVRANSRLEAMVLELRKIEDNTRRLGEVAP